MSLCFVIKFQNQLMYFVNQTLKSEKKLKIKNLKGENIDLKSSR